MKTNVTTDYPSPLTMSNLIITNASFRYTPSKDDCKLNLVVNRKITELGENEYSVVINAVVSDIANNSIEVSVSCSANFSLPENLDDEEIKNSLINKSTLTIMFPYNHHICS